MLPLSEDMSLAEQPPFFDCAQADLPVRNFVVCLKLYFFGRNLFLKISVVLHEQEGRAVFHNQLFNLHS